MLLSVNVFKELFRKKKNSIRNITVTPQHRLIETLVTLLAFHHSKTYLHSMCHNTLSQAVSEMDIGYLEAWRTSII